MRVSAVSEVHEPKVDGQFRSVGHQVPISEFLAKTNDCNTRFLNLLQLKISEHF